LVTSIQRWGNSLAVRIPKAFAAEATLGEDSTVDIALNDENIVISPARRDWKLDDLVRKITPANRHHEVSWGDKLGKESW